MSKGREIYILSSEKSKEDINQPGHRRTGNRKPTHKERLDAIQDLEGNSTHPHSKAEANRAHIPGTGTGEGTQRKTR